MCISTKKSPAKTGPIQRLVIASVALSEIYRGVFRVLSSNSKAAMTRLNPALPKTRKDWVYAYEFFSIVWPQKAICSELSAHSSTLRIANLQFQ